LTTDPGHADAGAGADRAPADQTAREPVAAQEPQTTRRAFLGGGGRKALYVTPAVLTLAAQQAFASGFVCGSRYKHTVGSPCATDGSQKDCCPEDLSGNALECHTHMDGTTMTCEPPGSPL
jgi:hypothetical protein